ncbi:PAS/PAC Sensor Signal Transduction Histidine Kinase [alpha proteobacterium BAL199]|nr:PAS/PAC Sensor Signal Transduction Histidine Kinase [alpha proteobacterium BAL199]
MQQNRDLVFLHSLDEGVVGVNDASTIVFVNASAERMFGYSAAEMLGQSLDVLIPENHRDRHESDVEKFRQSAQSSRMMQERGGVTGRRKDGNQFDAEVSISKISFDGGQILLALVRDVTERARADARLRALEARHRVILETCADAVLLADAVTGAILDANDQAGALFGCDGSALIGIHKDELCAWDQDNRDGWCVERTQAAGRVHTPNATIRRRDGQLVPVEITSGMTQIDGAPTLVGFFRDITPHKAREEELVEAQLAAKEGSESKTRFLANVSHELRTPLNAIIGMSEIIRDEMWGGIGNPKYREYATDINDSGLHLLDVINAILDYSRIEMDKVTLHDDQVDVVGVLDQSRRTVQRLLDEGGLTCELQAKGPLVLVADRRSVRQMLLNLLSNAIKHTPPGGRITLTAEAGNEGELVLTVRDSGEGIPRERLALVTEPFNLDEDISVSRQGGTGLGLAITKGLIKRHGGAMSINSRVGEGTTVRLVFPAERVPFGGPWRQLRNPEDNVAVRA